jgi:phosphoadenosine phosphosulfate reductase
MNKILQAEELTKVLSNSSAKDVMIYFIEKYKEKLAFASSLGAEDEVLTHLLSDIDKKVKIFTL